MIDAEQILPFNFFRYGGTYTGEHGSMRYKIARTGEKPDFQLQASVWEGPNASDKVPAEAITKESFEYSENGRIAAIEWLRSKCEK